MPENDPVGTFVDKLSPERKKELLGTLEETEKKMSEFAGFGDFDITDIPESIVRGTYVCVMTEAKLITPNEDKYDLGGKFWAIKFEVDSEQHQEFTGETAKVTVNIFTKLNKEKFDNLPESVERGIDQKNVRNAIKFFKKFAKQLGYSPEEIALGVNFEEKLGQKFKCSLYPDRDGQTKINVSAGISPVTEVGDDAFTDFDL